MIEIYTKFAVFILNHHLNEQRFIKSRKTYMPYGGNTDYSPILT